jgi:hypothetical protein
MLVESASILLTTVVKLSDTGPNAFCNYTRPFSSLTVHVRWLQVQYSAEGSSGGPWVVFNSCSLRSHAPQAAIYR